MHYFLEDDFNSLNEEISKVIARIAEFGQEMGESCREGAETWHDNFAYEEGVRQQAMWSKRLSDLISIRNNARIVKPAPNEGKVTLGRRVTIQDNAGRQKTLVVGSFQVLCEKHKEGGHVSYRSPLVCLLISRQVGDVVKGKIGQTEHEYRILSIE